MYEKARSTEFQEEKVADRTNVTATQTGGAKECPETVFIQGHNFYWSEATGLEPDAIMTLQHWIKKQAKIFLSRALFLNVELEDLIQAGNIGALNAARTFRPECSRGFLSWANLRIIDEMRRLCNQSPVISLDADNGNDSKPFSGQIVDSANRPSGTEQEIQLEQLISKLSGYERDILAQYYGLGDKTRGQSYEAIGKKYGVSGESIRNHIDKAIRRMRKQVVGRR